MKLKALLLACVLALFAPRFANAEVSFDFFYDSLSPYGEWIEVGDYGSCWRPSGVDADWSPYSDGYWSYTDGGWTWVSYEDFGGIVYHYGRWVQVEDEGWCWVPDYQWAPAWVSWRSNDDYVGWAPLPPEARWHRDTGISVWADAHYDIGPSRYSFCHVHDFGEPYLRPVIINRFENVTIIQHTSNVTNISYYDGGGYGGLVHCGGPIFSIVNRHVNRPIPALKLVQNTNITNINIKQVNVFNSVQRGNQLTVLAPRVSAPVDGSVRPKPVRTIAAAKVNKGWAGVKDPDLQETIRTKVRQDAKNLAPENAPARRVQAVDLKAVPNKADPNAPSPLKNAKVRTAPVSFAKDKDKTIDKTPAGAEQPIKIDPIPPRTVEKGGRERPREMARPGDDKPAVVVESPKNEPEPTRTLTKLPKPTSTVENPKVRKAPRQLTPEEITPPTNVKKFTTEPVERAPIVRSKPSAPDAAEKARDAAIERQRAVQDSAKRQNEAATEMKRHEAAMESARRKESSQAIARQRPVEVSRDPSADIARKQQLDEARRQQASEKARQIQIEPARRQQAVEIPRQPKVERQAPAQIERQAPVMKRQPPVVQQPQPSVKQQVPPSSGGKRRLTPEEIAELKKKQGL